MCARDQVQIDLRPQGVQGVGEAQHALHRGIELRAAGAVAA
jgi:hypothetical protein